MKKENKLLKNLEQMLKQLNCREFLHRFGPKKYKLKQHFFSFVVMTVCRLSFRRVSALLEMFGFKAPTYSALCKSRKRIPLYLWQRVMSLTAGYPHYCVAIDSTGFSTVNPSHHYIKRIDRKNPVKSYIKQSSLFDTRKKTFVALRVRAKPRHDIKDAKYLMGRVDVQTTLYGDTAYDAESLHQYCYEKGIQTQIKPRKNVKRGRFRKKQMKNYSEEEYHQRSLIEAGQGAVKRKYGGYTLTKGIQSARAEAYCKAICYNIRLGQLEIFN